MGPLTTAQADVGHVRAERNSIDSRYTRFMVSTRTMNLSDFDPEYVFSHHSATPEKLKQYEAIHESAKQFARVVLENVPASIDRVAVIQLLREASMLACSAISLDGRLKP